MQVPDSPASGDTIKAPGPQPIVPQVFLAMAAAQMHSEGRLFDPTPLGPAQKFQRPSMDFTSKPLWLGGRR